MTDLGLGVDLWPWAWLIIAVALVLLELTVLGGSFMVLPFGVSAFLTALLAFADVSLEVQWAVFGLGGGVLFLVFWRYQELVQRGNVLPPGVGATRLVGLTGTVTQTIDPADPQLPGRVDVDGETWLAMATDGAVIEAGTPVRVTDVEGTRVQVRPVDAGPARPDPALGTAPSPPEAPTQGPT